MKRKFKTPQKFRFRLSYRNQDRRQKFSWH